MIVSMPKRLRRRFAILCAVVLCLGGAALSTAFAQMEKTEPFAGLRENTPEVFALTNARVIVSPGVAIDRCTVVMRDGIITAVGADVAVPADARVWDLKGRTVYAGFIDAFEKPEAPSGGGRGRSGGRSEGQGAGTPESKGGAGYWNDNITPQKRASESFEANEDANKTLRSQGIAARLWTPGSGIIKGTAVLVNTADEDNDRVVLAEDVALCAQLTPNRGTEGYPDSPMGAFALFRQSFYDAAWYADAWAAYNKSKSLPRPERNDALQALQPYHNSGRPVIIDASNALYVLRADKAGAEFGLNVIVNGSGDEYRRLDEIRQTGRPIIVPLNFPKAPDVSTPERVVNASLEDLMHWNLAPENPWRLDSAGVTIAFTSNGLKDKKEFLAQVRKAVNSGLSQTAALRALTTTPARLFGMEKYLGTVEAGKLANLVIADGNLFDDDTKIIETWVDGHRYEVETEPVVDARGTWQVALGSGAGSTPGFDFKLKGTADKPKGTAEIGEYKADLSSVDLVASRLAVSFTSDSLGHEGVAQFSASVQGDSLIGGLATWPDGTRFTWSAKRTQPFVPEPDTAMKKEESARAIVPVDYPLGAFGRTAPPPQPAAVLFKNATVWTCGPQGKLENASVLVRNGKIAAVGQIAAPEGAQVIDLHGQHLTPGIIDCHSHIATDGGINESGQTISAEVRIGDFMDPDDIAIYRQLGGGVTSSNILHGSANTIGGQCQPIKLRWGVGPEALKFEGAPPCIKFALGENVKQSNWGERFNTRYPQTRMGVEQLVRDEFTTAREYEQRWKDWNHSHKGIPPRRDLELDAIVEVLNGKRLIHCHSYRQDEILALMRTCEDFGVRIQTFQHILEGYKVADVMARHGVGGSSFSDWWAYKIEVYDAIPYNGVLMHDQGVVVSFNSDDSELARRLYLEAAKAMKYGGVPEQEALKFVTINSARQMGIDNRVGSIEVGKDADLAVWSHSPLSIMTVCMQTWIDGRKYFDREEDKQIHARDEKWKAELVQKVLAAGDSGKGGGRKGPKWPREDIFCGHCNGTQDEEAGR